MTLLSAILDIGSLAEALRVLLAYLAGMASLAIVLACAFALRQRDIKAAKTWERQVKREPDSAFIERAAQGYEARTALRRLGAKVKPE